MERMIKTITVDRNEIIGVATIANFTWTNAHIFRTECEAKRKAHFSALLEGADTIHGAAFLFAPKQIGFAQVVVRRWRPPIACVVMLESRQAVPAIGFANG